MGKIIILYWRDIPAQVIARSSRHEQEKHILSPRFAEAIDNAAMRSRAHDSEDYLQAWRRSSGARCGDDLKREAEQKASEIEKEFDDARLARLVANGGLESPEQ